VSEKVWVLLIGGMLGILMMRTVAKLFLVLIDKIPELENTAFVLIGIIALKMGASAFHYEMPHVYFFGIIIAAFVVTFIIHFMNKQKQVREQTAASKEE
jgi:predicted tellurium resistance membrane protein TerC